MPANPSVKLLASLNPETDSPKAHHTQTGFRNPWPSFRDHRRWELLRIRFGSNPEKNFVPVPQGPDGARSDELVQVLKPSWGQDQPDKLRATWLGHASFLVKTPAAEGAERGVRILFDPVFSERTSPFSFVGPKRYTPTPCTVDELPDVDIICISHNHYDHLDIYTISSLYNKLKDRVHIFAGLRTKDWFLDNVHCAPEHVTELEWWDNCEVDIVGKGSVRLTFCPAQHTSGRTPWDTGKALWGSWALETACGKKLYFAGDTAYQATDTPSPCPVFAQIGELFGTFDLAMIPIGLCSPPSLMASVHAHPEQSLEIHKAVKSKLSIGMHYGTVRGGISALYEDVRDPSRRWREAAEKEDIWCGGGVEDKDGVIDVSREGCGLCHVGETVAV